jgi:hypothetical protein
LDIPVAIRLFVTFGEISYFISDKKNTNDQEPGLILKTYCFLALAVKTVIFNA